MPELPEVETTCRGIKPHLLGQRIKGWRFGQKELRWPIPRKELKQLKGQRITCVSRRGKYILLSTNAGAMIIHLGMSGRLHILPVNATPKKHDHIDLILENGYLLRLNDTRRFGAWLWCKEDVNQHPLIEKLGVEPLSSKFSVQYLLEKSAKRRVSIKSLIMDHQVVVGVGNIYATEVLFMAKINPMMPANQLQLIQADSIVTCIKSILKKAIKSGGTTLKDFLHSDGKPGYFSLELLAYGRAGQACVHCQTELKAVRQQQRKTVYCPACQTNGETHEKNFNHSNG